MRHLTPELLAMSGGSHVETEHGQLLFSATQEPLKRISSGNFAHSDPLFELCFRSRSEMSQDQILPDGSLIGEYEDMPRTSIKISTRNLLRILGQGDQPHQITEDVLDYTQNSMSHEFIWTEAHYPMPTAAHSDSVPLDAASENVQLVIEGEYDKSATVLCGNKVFPPKWILGRNHMRTTGEDQRDAISRQIDQELDREFGTDDLTFAELRAGLWIAGVIDRHFPPLVRL